MSNNIEKKPFQLQWKDASEKPETTGTTYLYKFKNESGNSVTLTAHYFGPNELELDYDSEPFEGCTVDEEEDMTFCPAGWYEIPYNSDFGSLLPQNGKWCEFPRDVEADNV